MVISELDQQEEHRETKFQVSNFGFQMLNSAVQISNFGIRVSRSAYFSTTLCLIARDKKKTLCPLNEPFAETTSRVTFK